MIGGYDGLQENDAYVLDYFGGRRQFDRIAYFPVNVVDGNPVVSGGRVVVCEEDVCYGWDLTVSYARMDWLNSDMMSYA